MKKSLILAVLLMPLVSVTFAQTVWNGKADTDWYSNNTSAIEFTIITAEQLAGLAELVNSGNSFKGKTVKLGSNIMLNDIANWQNWASHAPANKWIPIGIKDSNSIFNGIFDGSGYVVNGVYINNTNNSQGLFRNVDSVGTIKNLGVIASYIKGSNFIGGLVGGMNFGMINNSYFTGIVAGDSTVGGLVSGNLGIISNSYSASVVTGNLWIGGLVGENRSKINNSYSINIVNGKNALVV